MTQRPGSARGGLTIAQAQELILAQALAARSALPEPTGQRSPAAGVGFGGRTQAAHCYSQLR